MGRLFPLTLEKTIYKKTSDLMDDEVKQFKDLHNEILLMDEDITPETVVCNSKEFYAPATKQYNHMGNSAGQYQKFFKKGRWLKGYL